MPNWCENTVLITGASEDISSLVTKYQSRERLLDFDKVLPTPSDLLDVDTEERKRENKKLYGFRDWYDWRIAHWGTKWNSSGEHAEQFAESVRVNFDTAWSPPLEILDKVAEDNKELVISLSYDEPGMGFRGQAEWRNGSRESESVTEYCDYTLS